MDAIWNDMMVSGIPLAEKVIRTIAVYGFLIAGLRLFGKRELGQLNPLDFIVLLLLSNTVQNAIIGNDNSLAGGLHRRAVLMIINSVLVRVHLQSSAAAPAGRRARRGTRQRRSCAAARAQAQPDHARGAALPRRESRASSIWATSHARGSR